jgi:hypothetical protein
MKNPSFKLFKAAVTVWLIFHISVMIVMSNGSSFFARSMGNFYRFYANQLNINTNWNFFSPDPAQVMYIQYTVYTLDDYGNDLQPALEEYFPKEKNQGSFGLTHRRDFYLSRYLLLSEERMENMFAPWVCRQHPQATNILVQTMVEKVTPLDEMVRSQRNNVRMEQSAVFKKEFRCTRQ